jgi:CheY-like chemotaxis protein
MADLAGAQIDAVPGARRAQVEIGEARHLGLDIDVRARRDAVDQDLAAGAGLLAPQRRADDEAPAGNPGLVPTDAIAVIREDPAAWDLVITDYDMPGMNGAQLAKTLRKHRADLPILPLTALPRVHQLHQGPDGMFDGVLGKPASAEWLAPVRRRRRWRPPANGAHHAYPDC